MQPAGSLTTTVNCNDYLVCISPAAPPPDVPVFCSDDTMAPHVPLSALLPQPQSLVDNANAELGELSVFWARTGSKSCATR